MYKLDVSKSALLGFEVCLHKEGCSVDEYLIIDDDSAAYLVDVGGALAKSENSDAVPTGSISLTASTKYGNAFQLVVKVTENYFKVHVLTKVELKLFLASLKRAIDG